MNNGDFIQTDRGNNGENVSEVAPKMPFTPPRWKKINGNEHTTSAGNIQYDLLSIEEFLNKMLACGWCPVRVRYGTSYTFIPCAPGEYLCRTVMTVTNLGFFDKRKAVDLNQLLADNGAWLLPQESTFGSQIGLIALKPAASGSFQITTDLDSRIAEYEARKRFGERFGLFFALVALMDIAAGLISQPGFIGCGCIFMIISGYYYRPVPRLKRIIGRLKAQRIVSEA